MNRTGFYYKKSTGEIITKVQVSQGSDLALNKRNGLVMFEVSNQHSALTREHEYQILDGKIKRKPEAQINKEKKQREEAGIQRRMPEYLKDDTEILNEILIEHINALKEKAGFPNIDLNTIKAELNQRREQYKNPDKK